MVRVNTLPLRQLTRDFSVGVVTKPDTVTKGSVGTEKKWKNIFEGKIQQHRLRLGYYCVRLLRDNERSQNANLQQTAMRYFSVTSPWKDLEVKDRLGVDALVKDISDLLMKFLKDA